ncbi:hypothetical protein ABTM70_19520, partial [Acinetobacter baumannii]
GVPIPADDRLVFTEDNPARELTVAAQLATVARVMKARDAAVAADALGAAREVFARAIDRTTELEPRVFALAELWRTTGERGYLDRLLKL